MDKLVLAHGWGYSRHVFAPLLHSLQQSCQAMPCVLVWDQGYFDESGPGLWLWANDTASPWVRQANLTLHGRCIGIGHSQGLAHLLRLPNTSWRSLISLQGFACFVRSAHNPHGVALRVLQHMHAMLQQNPSEVLAQFYKRCGDVYTPQQHPERSQALPAWCIQALSQGLQTLQQQDLRPALQRFLDQGGALTAVLAQDDALLHPAHASLWPSTCTQHTLPGGHVPWLAHPKAVADYLASHLKS